MQGSNLTIYLLWCLEICDSLWLSFVLFQDVPKNVCEKVAKEVPEEEICGEIPQESCQYEPKQKPVESCHIEPKNECQVIQEYVPVQKCRNIAEVYIQSLL